MEEDIKKRVVDEIYWDNRVDASDIKVDVKGTVVTLSGTVPDRNAVDAAEADAWLARDVTDVINQIEIEHPEEIVIPEDEKIADHLDQRLVWDTTIQSSKVDIDADSGVVTLEGTIDVYWKKTKIENIAYETLGVLEVINNIAVVPTDDYVDESIAQDITDALERRLGPDAGSVDVEVVDGKVTLTGSVPDWASYRMALDSAEFTSGVVDVEETLVVAPE